MNFTKGSWRNLWESIKTAVLSMALNKNNLLYKKALKIVERFKRILETQWIEID